MTQRPKRPPDQVRDAIGLMQYETFGERNLAEVTDMKLSKLLTALSDKEVHGYVDMKIGGLAQDSRQVRPGDLFVAVKGLDADGHEFIPDAIRRGTVAVVGEREASISVPYVLVPDSRQALAHLAAVFHGHPAHKASVVGDTVGDPFKDTAGPSLNTLITVMSLVSSLFAPIIAAFHLF